MRKKLLLVLTLLMLTVTISAGCGKSLDNSTPEKAAKTFMQALINGDSKVLEELNMSSPLQYPTHLLLSMATEWELSKYSINDFTFEKVGNNVVRVKSAKARIDIKFEMVQKDGKWYFYDIKRI